MARKTICLNMIVKNESKIIERCLKSVDHLVDTWCIIDTGSTDGTQDIIKNFFKNKPGVLHERPFVNFGHNRSEALSLAKGMADWIMLTDADMILVDNGFDHAVLEYDIDAFDVVQENAGVRYDNFRLLKDSCNWKCIGVTHEYYGKADDTPPNRVRLDSIFFQDPADGGSKQDKFERDIRLLKQGLLDEPGNARYMFYLAQSYRDIREWEKAVKWYRECVKHSKWDEEKFFAAYMVGWCMSFDNKPVEEVAEEMFKAWIMRPWRIEPIFHLSMIYKSKDMWEQTYALLKICATTQYPTKDLLFITAATYEGLAIDEFAVSAFWTGNHQESIAAIQKLLNEGTYGAGNPEVIARLRNNLYLSERALGLYDSDQLATYIQEKTKEIDSKYN